MSGTHGSPSVVVVHNASAGGAELDGEQLRGWVEAAGRTAVVVDPGEPGWLEVLGERTQAVLVAGGDGTVATVLLALADRSLPVGVVPLGTANNVARTLGCRIDDPAAAVHAALGSTTTRFDLPLVDGRRFVESVGGGLFATTMRTAEDAQQHGRIGGQLHEALALLHHQLSVIAPMEWGVQVDGVDHSGAYLAVEVMNIASVGPGVELAPGADPGDGRVEVVTVPEAARARLLDHVGGLLHGTGVPPLDLVRRDARAVRLAVPEGVDLRRDDELLAPSEELVVTVDGAGVDVLTG